MLKRSLSPPSSTPLALNLHVHPLSRLLRRHTAQLKRLVLRRLTRAHAVNFVLEHAALQPVVPVRDDFGAVRVAQGRCPVHVLHLADDGEAGKKTLSCFSSEAGSKKAFFGFFVEQGFFVSQVAWFLVYSGIQL